jgi:coenzyme PQQ synthesis protein D (PqqD)
MLANERSESGLRPRTRRDLIVQAVGEEGLIYDREGALVHILNLTALHAWRLLDGTRTAAEIEEDLARSFRGAAAEDVHDDVKDLLNTLAKRGLLEASP